MIYVALALALTASEADAIDTTRDTAVEEEQLAFCADPAKPLGPRQRSTCALAHELEDCKGLVEACDADLSANHYDWLDRLVAFLAPVAQWLLYAMIGVIVVAVLIPVVAALRQLQRRKRAKETAPAAPNVAQLVTADAPPPDEVEPAESLRHAEDSLARGEYRAALVHSLAASLGALGRRGAIRLRKDRTNGEYVRSCQDDSAKPALREIVNAVDAVEFGGATATSERAQTVVKRAAVIVSLGLVLLGCEPPKRGTDPAGDELPVAVLARNGFTIAPLGSSLATLPVPDAPDEDLPIIVIDTERVPLESETQAHLLRWVEAGGSLVLFGKASHWPAEIAGKYELAETRDLRVGGFEARVGHRDAFEWKDHTALAKLGDKTYAAKRRFGRGYLLGVANDDLWTNVGVMPKHNAAALVTLLRAVSRGHQFEVRVAKPEDGVPPPSNPFAALIAAGLGKGAWHALAAAILLFLCYGVRHARPRSAPGAPRRAFVEHVEATGAFYGRAPARSHALASYGRFVELRLRELAPRGTDPAAFLAARTGAEAEHVSKLLARALEAKTEDVPKGDELEVIEELRALLRRI